VESVVEIARPPSERRATALRDARIIADHVRALVFAIAEGALPGNEGAGYVLRRLLRRAVTRGRSRRGLAIHQPFLAATAERAIEQFAGHYRELAARRPAILKVMEQEEAGFTQTFEAGLTRLEAVFARVESARKPAAGEGRAAGAPGRVCGEDAFVLHDTYGFPVELTEELARERGLEVDRDGYERAMEEQRARARAASKFGQEEGAGSRASWTVVSEGADSEFLGYRTLAAEGLTLRRWREHAPGAGSAREIELVLDRTPFYAESGGQVADRGAIEGGGARAELAHVHKEGECIVHRLRLVSGTPEALIAAGRSGALAARVDPAHRTPTMRHHTATHLLHAALRQHLGTHVRQAGSLVAPDRLRFDYAHFEATSPAQLDVIERTISDWVAAKRDVSWKILALDEAKRQGAMALFGEKYGAVVRMVTVDGVPDLGIEPSRELCGGTHVSNTGDIGAFVVVAESAIAAGVRRVEARCGAEAVEHLRAQLLSLAERDVTEIGRLQRQIEDLGGARDGSSSFSGDEYLASVIRKANSAAAQAGHVGEAAVVRGLRSTLDGVQKELGARLESLKSQLATLRKTQSEEARGGLEAEMARLAEGATAVGSARLIVAEIRSEADANAVREAADRLRGALGRGAAVLALRSGDKLTFLAAVTDDLVAEKKLRADELVRAVAKVAGGSGGGKPHLALAGAKDSGRLEDALAEARRLLAEALGS
jgi:alanyl-tRNA synthetase